MTRRDDRTEWTDFMSVIQQKGSHFVLYIPIRCMLLANCCVLLWFGTRRFHGGPPTQPDSFAHSPAIKVHTAMLRDDKMTVGIGIAPVFNIVNLTSS